MSSMLRGNLGSTVIGAVVTTAVVVFVASVTAMLYPALGSGLENSLKVLAGAVIASFVPTKFKGGLFLGGVVFALTTWIAGILVFGQAFSVDIAFIIGTTVVYMISKYVWNLGRGNTGFN
jgi:hypothetical protein